VGQHIALVVPPEGKDELEDVLERLDHMEQPVASRA
jgi:hypothetical protein